MPPPGFTLDQVEVGKKYAVWVWTGDRAHNVSTQDLSEVTVIKKGKKRVRVKDYWGDEHWIRPDLLVRHWDD